MTQFRRNQTISSRRSSDEVAGGGSASNRHTLHDLATKRRKAGSVFLVAVGVVIVLSIILAQMTAKVSIVSASSGAIKPFDKNLPSYQEAVNSYFGVNPAERMRFALNEPKLTDYVNSLYPEVEQIKIAGGAPLEAILSFKFRQPVAGWQIGDKQYYVDSGGVVFEENYFNDPVVKIVDESGVEAAEGAAVASSRLLGFVGRVVALSKGRGYVVEKVVLPQDTTRRLDVSFVGVSYVVRFAIDRGAGEQVSDAARSIEYLSANGIGVSYIDVRVDGRAVYR